MMPSNKTAELRIRIGQVENFIKEKSSDKSSEGAIITSNAELTLRLLKEELEVLEKQGL